MPTPSPAPKSETNTFSSTRIAQADYGMQEVVYDSTAMARGLLGARL